MSPVTYPIEKVADAYAGIQAHPENHIITILDYSSAQGKKEDQSFVVLRKHMPPLFVFIIITARAIGCGYLKINLVLVYILSFNTHSRDT